MLAKIVNVKHVILRVLMNIWGFLLKLGTKDKISLFPIYIRVKSVDFHSVS